MGGTIFNIEIVIYVILIKAKLDYGRHLYKTASKSNLNKLDRIQYAAIHIALGTMKCIQTCNFEVSAGILTLSLQRKKLRAKYISRMQGVPTHPV